MSKYFKPVFDYKLSFDPNKGEKHTMKVVYTVVMDKEGRIGTAIPLPAEGAVAPPVTHKVQTRTTKVRMCQTTAMDEGETGKGNGHDDDEEEEENRRGSASGRKDDGRGAKRDERERRRGVE